MSVHVFGIRHHGPGCARSLRTALEELQPDCLLVEGPPDAQAALPLLMSEQMEPPVALLLYVPEHPSHAVFYPFTHFSPEWQALRYAFGHGIPARFMDLPQAIQLAREPETAEDDVAPGEPGRRPRDRRRWLNRPARAKLKSGRIGNNSRKSGKNGNARPRRANDAPRFAVVIEPPPQCAKTRWHAGRGGGLRRPRALVGARDRAAPRRHRPLRGHPRSDDRASRRPDPARPRRGPARGAHARDHPRRRARGLPAHRRRLRRVARAGARRPRYLHRRRRDPARPEAHQSRRDVDSLDELAPGVSQRLRRRRHLAGLVCASLVRAGSRHDPLGRPRGAAACATRGSTPPPPASSRRCG